MNRNASRFLRTARLAAPALAAVTLTMAFAGPAAADPSFAMRSGGEIRFAALPGETNTVTFSIVGGNDTLVSKNGGFDRILCGSGFDILVADQAALDTVPTGAGCEFVVR